MLPTMVPLNIIFLTAAVITLLLLYDFSLVLVSLFTKIFRWMAAKPPRRLEHPKTLALLDGLHEQVVHLLLGGILGQEQDIEAGVSGGKPVRVGAILCNDQFQFGKSSNRDPIAASGELKQLSLVLQSHGVNRLPKPSDTWSLPTEATVILCGTLQLIEIKLLLATDKHLKLLRGEHHM